MRLNHLSENPGNPRVVSDDKLESLRKTIAEFGDLSGFVFNRRSQQLVGGHQRAKVFDPEAEIIIQKRYARPSRTGTVSVGYVDIEGERFVYREVDWDETKEKAAAIAANQNVGEWDKLKLRDWLKDIESDNTFDPDLTLFSASERKKLHKRFENAAKAKPDEEDQEPKEKKRVECPECHHRFVPGWSSN